MLSKRFDEAILFASELHRAQVRKGTGIPYIAHLLGVASIVLDHGGTEGEAIAALLHDAVEDQGGRPVLDKIRKRFGDSVAAIVEGCTDADVTPKPPWRERKEAYLKHLQGAASSVLLVSSADKLHNARALLGDYRVVGKALWGRFKGGKDGTLWYYRALADAFRANGPRAIADELDRVVSELERLAKGSFWAGGGKRW